MKSFATLTNATSTCSVESFNDLPLFRILENSPDPAWLMNSQWKIRDCNEAGRRLVHRFYNSEMTEGTEALGLPDNISRSEWHSHYQKAMNGDYFSVEMKFAGKMEDHYYN